MLIHAVVHRRTTLLALGLALGLAARARPARADGELSDEDLLRQLEDQVEVIEIFDERPDKPFDRDTEVRLTGEQLAARGAVDLSTALALLPDVAVQEAGRGGATLIIRGASKGQVTILIDGVSVSDPYYGTFDLTSVPITDIVEIRLSTTPQSPIDGPGGPGGVVEVHTRDAIGPQLVIARATADSLPTFGFSGTARAALAKNLAIRIAASGLNGARSLTLAAPFNEIDENRRDAAWSSRLEYRKDHRRVVVDAFANDRHYLVPPAETTTALLLIDRENNVRLAAKADDAVGSTKVQAQGWYQYLLRNSRSFSDPTYEFENAAEDLTAARIGGMALATRPIGKEARWAASVTIDHDSTHVSAGNPENPTIADGNVTLGEIAIDGQYEHRTIRLDTAVGVAVPFGIDADPWLELKSVAKWRPRFSTLEITGTVGRKGRVPSLRERFQPGVGDPSLAPETVNHAEIRAIEKVDDRLLLEAAPYYRYQQGTIIGTTQPPDIGRLINLGTLRLYGVDLSGNVRAHRMVRVGGAYNYVHAHSDQIGDDPLSHLPHHRAETWVRFAPREAFSLLVRGIFYGESFINQATTIPSYASVEATATWQISRDYLAVVRGIDLTDARPLIRPGVYGAGRTVSLVVQATWD